MKITRVDAFLMSCPMETPPVLPFWGGERTILKRDAMLIRVATDTDLVGYAPGPAHERAAHEIRHDIGPFLVGREPRQWEAIDFPSSSETAKTWRAVQIALAELTARFEGCPLSELLGARKRDRIKQYGSAGMYMSPEEYAEEAAAIASMGFPAYKMRPGIGPEQDLEAVSQIRGAVGAGLGLMVDAHTWWRMGDRSYPPAAIRDLANAMSAYGLVWLEEPLPPEDHAAYKRLAGDVRVKLASGEHEPDDAGFDDLIRSGGVEYVQMDLFCQGGLPAARRIFESVERHGLRFAFHSWGTALEVLTAAHLGVCWPEEVVEWLEYPCYSNRGRTGMYPFPLSDEILADPLQIEDGYLVVPEGPGLGIEIDERVVEKYPFISGPWSLFRLESPPETISVTGDHSVKWVEGETGV